MSILNKLASDGSALSKLNGGTPKTPEFSESKLHDTYSLNGDPTLTGKPSPTGLRVASTPAKYLDNLPS